MSDIEEIKKKQKQVMERLNKISSKIIDELGEDLLDSLRIDLRCAVTGKLFSILFNRESLVKKYKISKIITDDKDSRPGFDSLSNTKALEVDIDEIEISDIQCPYCEGGEWCIIKCGCGELSCAGGIKKIGDQYLHICPWCGTKGYVSGEIDKLSGELEGREIKLLGETERKKIDSDKKFYALPDKR